MAYAAQPSKRQMGVIGSLLVRAVDLRNTEEGAIASLQLQT